MTFRGTGLLTAAAATALTLLAADVTAQGRMGGGGRMGAGPMAGHYDAAAEVTVRGTIDEIRQGPGQGTHLMLKTPDGTLELVLGPTWYQTDRKYMLGKDDAIEAVGARSTIEERSVILVREVRKGSDTMSFRDAKGVPLWAGRGRQ